MPPRTLPVETVNKLIDKPGLFDQETEHAMLPAWCKNFAGNIETGLLSRYGGIGVLNGLEKGRPAVVCGGGPSLDFSLNLIKQAQAELERPPLIICCTTTLATLAQAEIRPDYVLALDGGPFIKMHLEGFSQWSGDNQVPLILSVCVEPQVALKWLGPVHYFVTTAGPGSMTDCFVYMVPQFGPEGWIPALGCVANACVYFAGSTLGCREIYLAGVDFCFLYDRGYCKRFTVDENFQFEPIPDPGPKSGNMLAEIEGVDGRTWLADKNMISYRRGLETVVQQNQGKAQFYRLHREGVVQIPEIPHIEPKEAIEKWRISQ